MESQEERIIVSIIPFNLYQKNVKLFTDELIEILLAVLPRRDVKLNLFVHTCNTGYFESYEMKV